MLLLGYTPLSLTRTSRLTAFGWRRLGPRGLLAKRPFPLRSIVRDTAALAALAVAAMPLGFIRGRLGRLLSVRISSIRSVISARELPIPLFESRFDSGGIPHRRKPTETPGRAEKENLPEQWNSNNAGSTRQVAPVTQRRYPEPPVVKTRADGRSVNIQSQDPARGDWPEASSCTRAQDQKISVLSRPSRQSRHFLRPKGNHSLRESRSNHAK